MSKGLDCPRRAEAATGGWGEDRGQEAGWDGSTSDLGD